MITQEKNELGIFERASF